MSLSMSSLTVAPRTDACTWTWTSMAVTAAGSTELMVCSPRLVPPLEGVTCDRLGLWPYALLAFRACPLPTRSAYTTYATLVTNFDDRQRYVSPYCPGRRRRRRCPRGGRGTADSADS